MGSGTATTTSSRAAGIRKLKTWINKRIDDVAESSWNQDVGDWVTDRNNADTGADAPPVVIGWIAEASVDTSRATSNSTRAIADGDAVSDVVES